MVDPVGLQAGQAGLEPDMRRAASEERAGGTLGEQQDTGPAEVLAERLGSSEWSPRFGSTEWAALYPAGYGDEQPPDFLGR